MLRMARTLLHMVEKFRATKFKLDASEFKLDAAEFLRDAV